MAAILSAKREDDRLLLQSEERGHHDLSNAYTFGAYLNAVRFPPKIGSNILDELKVTKITVRDDVKYALIVHTCLKAYSTYTPTFHDNLEDTITSIFEAAERAVPGFGVENPDGADYGTFTVSDRMLKEIEDNFVITVVDKEALYYIEHGADIIMDVAPIYKFKKIKPMWNLLINALRILQQLGLGDVRHGAFHETSDDDFFYDIEGDAIQRHPEWEEDEGERRTEANLKKLFKKNKKVVDAFKAELKERNKYFKPLLEELRKEPDIPLIEDYLKKGLRNDLSSWLAHLVMMYRAGFQLHTYIVRQRMDDVYQISADNCIGTVFNDQHYCYDYHFEEVESLAQEGGFTPIGCNMVYNPGGEVTGSMTRIPIMAWIRKALSFQISTLEYGRNSHFNA